MYKRFILVHIYTHTHVYIHIDNSIVYMYIMHITICCYILSLFRLLNFVHFVTKYRSLLIRSKINREKMILCVVKGLALELERLLLRNLLKYSHVLSILKKLQYYYAYAWVTIMKNAIRKRCKCCVWRWIILINSNRIVFMMRHSQVLHTVFA